MTDAKPHTHLGIEAVNNTADQPSSANNSADNSANNVEQHLLQLEKANISQRQLSDIAGQDFGDIGHDEVANLVNINRLQDLLSQSDEFLGYLTSEIDNFDDFDDFDDYSDDNGK